MATNELKYEIVIWTVPVSAATDDGKSTQIGIINSFQTESEWQCHQSIQFCIESVISTAQ